jgi:ATP-dependent RNA helicase RhlE
VIRCDQDRKRDLLLHLFAEHGWHQTLVFCRTKHGADALAKRLMQSGVRSAALHGNKTQGARTKALADFKAGTLAALVATDIAARGLDIDGLPRVINVDLPNVPEDYVHRIGRTGRAGNEGEALSLVSAEERVQLRDIERLMKKELVKSTVPGFEPKIMEAIPRAAPHPSRTPKPAQRSGAGGKSALAGRRSGAGGGGGGTGGKPARPAANPGRGAVHHNGQRHR